MFFSELLGGEAVFFLERGIKPARIFKTAFIAEVGYREVGGYQHIREIIELYFGKKLGRGDAVVCFQTAADVLIAFLAKLAEAGDTAEKILR